MTRFSIAIILLWAMIALMANFVGNSAIEVNLNQLLASPDLHAWLGYDELGRPVFQRLLLGAQTSFLVAIGVVMFSSIIGTSIGIYSAYSGGWTDRIVTKIIDVFLAFPGLLLAIALAAVLGPGIENVVFALVVVGWVSYARLARAQTLSLKNREHILAAKALGASTPKIMWLHLFTSIAFIISAFRCRGHFWHCRCGDFGSRSFFFRVGRTSPRCFLGEYDS